MRSIMVGERVRDLLYAGHAAVPGAAERKQILISATFSLVAIMFLLLFGCDSLATGKVLVARVTFGFAVIYGLNYIYLRQSGNHRVCSLVIVFGMMVLALFLLCTGGNNNSGPLWFYVMPSLVFYVLGLGRGALTVSLLLLFAASILYVPGNPLLMTTYPEEFVHRFLASLVSVSIIAWVYEFTREDGQKELIRLSERLDTLARRDELTGLANRRDMQERLQREIARHERNLHPFAILMMDIDRFKQVNDTYGHECGDAMLQLVADRLTANLQKRDTVSRWGGEEMLILLPETPLAQAHKIAERLRELLAATRLECKDGVVQVSASFGVAEYSPALTVSQLINEADGYLYQAKASGRNRVCSGYSP